eukprot:1326132-Amphidinium_carterae.2
MLLFLKLQHASDEVAGLIRSGFGRTRDFSGTCYTGESLVINLSFTFVALTCSVDWPQNAPRNTSEFGIDDSCANDGKHRTLDYQSSPDTGRV